MSDMVFYDEFSTLTRAYADAGEDGIPLLWTPAHVQTRLVEAMRVCVRATVRPGPRSFGNNMPPVIREFADFAGRGESGEERIEKWMQDVEAIRANRFSVDEMSRADEAISWCATYIAADPQQCDAIQAWAMCKAVGWSVEKLLRKRVIAAGKLMERRKQEMPDVVTVDRETADEIRRRIKAWAQDACTKEPKAKHKGIWASAMVRWNREIKAAKVIQRRSQVKPQDVMPGRVFTRAWLDQKRHAAAKGIADGLNDARVLVR